MPTYNVTLSGLVSVDASVSITAASEDEAIMKAIARARDNRVTWRASENGKSVGKLDIPNPDLVNIEEANLES